jgi:hypothetical protein
MQTEGVAPVNELAITAKIKFPRVSVYFNLAELESIASDAANAGFRRQGLPVLVKRPHGFIDEVNVNSDGISRFLKSCWKFQKENSAEFTRLQTKEKLLKELAALDKS